MADEYELIPQKSEPIKLPAAGKGSPSAHDEYEIAGPAQPFPAGSDMGGKPQTFGRFLTEFGSSVNPIPGVTDLVTHPVNTLNNMLQAGAANLDEIGPSIKRGDYGGALTRAMGSVLPGIGPAIAEARQDIVGRPAITDERGNVMVPAEQPDPVGGIAHMGGVLGQMYLAKNGPRMVRAIPGIPSQLANAASNIPGAATNFVLRRAGLGAVVDALKLARMARAGMGGAAEAPAEGPIIDIKPEGATSTPTPAGGGSMAPSNGVPLRPPVRPPVIPGMAGPLSIEPNAALLEQGIPRSAPPVGGAASYEPLPTGEIAPPEPAGPMDAGPRAAAPPDTAEEAPLNMKMDRVGAPAGSASPTPTIKLSPEGQMPSADEVKRALDYDKQAFDKAQAERRAVGDAKHAGAAQAWANEMAARIYSGGQGFKPGELANEEMDKLAAAGERGRPPVTPASKMRASTIQMLNDRLQQLWEQTK